MTNSEGRGRTVHRNLGGPQNYDKIHYWFIIKPPNYRFELPRPQEWAYSFDYFRPVHE